MSGTEFSNYAGEMGESIKLGCMAPGLQAFALRIVLQYFPSTSYTWLAGHQHALSAGATEPGWLATGIQGGMMEEKEKKEEHFLSGICHNMVGW